MKKKGRLEIEVINFNQIFKRKVMRSGKVGKIYLPRELIDKEVYVVIDMKRGEG